MSMLWVGGGALHCGHVGGRGGARRCALPGRRGMSTGHVFGREAGLGLVGGMGHKGFLAIDF